MRTPTRSRFLLLIVGLFANSWFVRAQEQPTSLAVKIQGIESILGGDGQHPIKCGTGQVAQIVRDFSRLDPATQTKYRVFSERLTFLPDSYVSQQKHFRIHYTTSGIHRIDATSTNPDGVPDYVYEAALTAEHAYHILVDSLGFKPHISDGGVDGPEYDFYLIDIGSYFQYASYGLTVPETMVSDNPERWTAYSYIENDFTGDFYTHGLEALHVTVAHEYFHAVQFNYSYRDDDVFFFEMTSTWFEDVAYPQVNDYLAYLTLFFQNTNISLDAINGWHEYGACIWLHYWLKNREYASLRRIWENSQTMDALQSIKKEVEDQKVSFVRAVGEFFSWCSYTGGQAKYNEDNTPKYFSDAPLFPTIRYSLETYVATDTTLVGFTAPLAAQFYRIHMDATKDFGAVLKGSSSVNWLLNATPVAFSGTLGDFSSQEAIVPYTLKAAENDGQVILLVVNSELTTATAGSTIILAANNFELNLTFKELGPVAEGLFSPRPNPFRPGRDGAVEIFYYLNGASAVRISILDELGRVIQHENLGQRPPGLSRYVWNGKSKDHDDPASGVYFVLLESSKGLQQLKKLAIVR